MMRVGFHFRVGSLLNGAFLGLTAMVVVLLGLRLITNFGDMTAASRLVTLAEADRTVFNTMQVLRVSRGEVQTALLNLENPSVKLAELRAVGSAKYLEAVAVLPRIGGVALDALVVDLRTRWDETEQKWQDLGAAAAKPKPARKVADTDVWYKSTTRVLDSLNDASLRVAAEARLADPYVAEMVAARQTAWSIRETVGSECSALRATVAANEPLSPANLTTIGRLRGADEAGWSALKGLMVRSDVPSKLVSVVTAGERDFNGAMAARDEVYRELGKGSASSVTPAQWTTLCNAPFEPIMAIALTALDLMQQRAESQYDAARFALLATIAVTLLVLSAAALMLRSIRRRVIQPVKALNDSIGHLSRQEYDAPVPQVGHDDEFSAMAETLESLRQGTIKSELANAERQAAQASDIERAARLGTLCREFQISVGRTLDTVAGANQQMVVAADAMTDTATDATRRTDEIARAVQQAAESINSVAGASEEMRTSLAEVSTKVEQSSKLSADAVGEAEETNRNVARLSVAAAEIGQVVGVISTIAAQTNLLALNATIEAARAGEHGRGFAVVAGEVKSLASQTAIATGQITAQVSAIQAATESAVLAMDGIGARIREVDGLTGAITQAIQGQVNAMNQVSRDAQEVALLTDRVSTQLNEVQAAAAGTVTAAGQVRQTTDDLGRQSGHLSLEIERFIAGVG
jgi:methyl-accepting chemotaxis protein